MIQIFKLTFWVVLFLSVSTEFVYLLAYLYLLQSSVNNQTVSIQVSNRLINEELSIHWHGMYQNSTPWMDGVAHITQCPIPPSASFHYIFKAEPSGTMWYHSHVGTQRTEGIFGAFIVREPQDDTDMMNIQLHHELLENFTIEDDARHTVLMLDWQREDNLKVALKIHYKNPFFLPDTNQQFQMAYGPDGAVASKIPYWAGLINGLGRQMKVPYAMSRLSIFNIDYRNANSPQYYRFRLVGSQFRYMYRLSISEHKLIVIATDGFLTKPMEVDYIHVHTGERYDFLLKPKTMEETNGKEDFLILAETVEVDTPNVAEAILHYGNASGDPQSTRYQQIVNDTIPRNCTPFCRALNCPFERYPQDLGIPIECIPVTKLQLLFPTEYNLPSNYILPKNNYFFDFSSSGSDGSPAVNGRNFVLPSGSLQTTV